MQNEPVAEAETPPEDTSAAEAAAAAAEEAQAVDPPEAKKPSPKVELIRNPDGTFSYKGPKLWRDKQQAKHEEPPEPAAEEVAKEQAKEPEPEKPAEEPKKADPFSEKFAELARAQKKFREEQEAAKPLLAEAEEFRKLKASAPTNPDAALKALGLSYEAVTQFYLSGKPAEAPKSDAISAEVAELRKWREAQEREKAETLKQSQRNQALDLIRSEVSKEAEKFETIQALGAHDMVLQHIENVHRETGVVLDVSEAADAVETFLFEKQVAPVLTTKKVQSKLSVASPQPSATRPPAQGQQSSRTLKNSLATAAPTPPEERKPKTVEEAVELAASVLRKRRA